MEIDISTTNKYSFKGYDARRLRGFLMTTDEGQIAKKMQSIGDQEGFKIFLFKNKDKNANKWTIWAQDIVTIYKNKLFFHYNDKLEYCINLFKHISGILPNCTINKSNEKAPNIEGGNMYIVKNGDRNELIIGEDELQEHTLEEIKCAYNVDRVITIPQMDFHIDLFIRPLDNKRVLLADDNMSLSMLKQILANVENYSGNMTNQQLSYSESVQIKNTIIGLKKLIRDFKQAINSNDKHYDKKVEEKLTANGYEVIRVPGRIYNYNKRLKHSCNFINANVLKNKNNELVYITNGTLTERMYNISQEILKKAGGNIEDYYKQIISPYIKPNHIYFVDGDNNYLSEEMLYKLGGGIHCLSSEIPENI